MGGKKAANPKDASSPVGSMGAVVPVAVLALAVGLGVGLTVGRTFPAAPAQETACPVCPQITAAAAAATQPDTADNDDAEKELDSVLGLTHGSPCPSCPACSAQLGSDALQGTKRAVLEGYASMSTHLREQPTYADKGAWLMEQEMHGEARHFFLKAAAEAPTDPRNWIELYDCETALGNPSRALRYLWRAAEMSPKVLDMFDAQKEGLLESIPAEKRELVEAEVLAFQKERATQEQPVEPPMPPLPAGSQVVTLPAVLKAERLWSTPIHVVNLQSKEGPEFNEALSQLAITGFTNYSTGEGKGVTLEYTGAAKDHNDGFFEHQNKGLGWCPSDDGYRGGTGWKELRDLPEFVTLRSYVDAAFQRFLKQEAAPTAYPEQHVSYSWTSVHKGGQGHNPHVHGDSLLSGVYYARVPEEAGAIVFHDPRGVSGFDQARDLFDAAHDVPAAYPPFYKPYRFAPKEGDLIIFPSWLVHGVEGTASDSARVSFAFNLVGDWHTFD